MTDQHRIRNNRKVSTQKKQRWITDDIKKQHPELVIVYRQINAIAWYTIPKKLQTARDNWIQMQYKSIDGDIKYRRNNKRDYQILRTLLNTMQIGVGY